jgi:hypothetical protein
MELQFLRHYRLPMFLLACAIATAAWANSVNLDAAGFMTGLMARVAEAMRLMAMAMLGLSAVLFAAKFYTHWKWQTGRGVYCYICCGLVESRLERSVCLRCGRRQRSC